MTFIKPIVNTHNTSLCDETYIKTHYNCEITNVGMEIVHLSVQDLLQFLFKTSNIPFAYSVSFLNECIKSQFVFIHFHKCTKMLNKPRVTFCMLLSENGMTSH